MQTQKFLWLKFPPIWSVFSVIFQFCRAKNTAFDWISSWKSVEKTTKHRVTTDSKLLIQNNGRRRREGEEGRGMKRRRETRTVSKIVSIWRKKTTLWKNTCKKILFLFWLLIGKYENIKMWKCLLETFCFYGKSLEACVYSPITGKTWGDIFQRINHNIPLVRNERIVGNINRKKIEIALKIECHCQKIERQSLLDNLGQSNGVVMLRRVKDLHYSQLSPAPTATAHLQWK